MAFFFLLLSQFLLVNLLAEYSPSKAWEGQVQEGRVGKGPKDKSNEQLEVQEQRPGQLGECCDTLGRQQHRVDSGIGDKK